VSLLDCGQQLEWYPYLLYRIGDSQKIGHKCSNGTVDVVVVIQLGWFSLAGRRLICVKKQDTYVDDDRTALTVKFVLNPVRTIDGGGRGTRRVVSSRLAHSKQPSMTHGRQVKYMVQSPMRLLK